MTEILMPRLTLTMKEGTVTEWFKKEGAKVEKGERLVEVLSEKATFEVEAPASGVLRKIFAEAGTDIPVAGTLGIITAPNEELPAATEAPPTPTAATMEPEIIPKTVEATRKKRIIASPAAKRLAKEQQIDLTQLKGSGPQGRIIEDDVRRLIDKTKNALHIHEVIPLTGIRKSAAEHVSLSARTAPQSTITMEVDMSNLAESRKRAGVSYTDLLVKAVAKVLTDHRILNATIDDNQITTFADINIGVAVATERGLIVPVIRNANKKSVTTIASTLKELIVKAKHGKLAQEDVSQGTFTITNLGMLGIDVFTPILNYPETAILGVGRIVEKPRVVQGQITIRSVMQLSLTFDHRVVDGAPAAAFLQKVKQHLESPDKLLT